MNSIEAKEKSKQGRNQYEKNALKFFMDGIEGATKKGWLGVIIYTDKYDDDIQLQNKLIRILNSLGYSCQIKQPCWFLSEEYDTTEYHITWA